MSLTVCEILSFCHTSLCPKYSGGEVTRYTCDTATWWASSRQVVQRILIWILKPYETWIPLTTLNLTQRKSLRFGDPGAQLRQTEVLFLPTFAMKPIFPPKDLQLPNEFVNWVHWEPTLFSGKDAHPQISTDQGVSATISEKFHSHSMTAPR